MITINREFRKTQLRRRIIDTENKISLERTKDDNIAVRKWLPKIHWRIKAAIIILLFLGGITWNYQRNHMFTRQTTVWEMKISEGSLVKYETFGNNVLKITKDGASYIDDNGENIWIISYEMKNPIVSVNGNYAAIADMQGNHIYICNTDGVQGLATTTLPISKVTVSGIGVAAAILEDTASSHIGFFRKDGAALDITITASMLKSGYHFDISLSQDSTQLMASYIYIQNGELKSRVVLYNFSEIGKTIAGRLVGGFDEPFQGAFVGAVQFLRTPYSCAFSTNGLTFFSSENLTSPTIVTQILVDEEIQSIFHSDDYVGIIVKNISRDFVYRMEIYSKNGKLVMKKDFTYDYNEIAIDGNLVILNNQTSCQIYNMAGVLKLNTSFDFTISKIRQGNSPNTLLLTGPLMMKKIKLH